MDPITQGALGATLSESFSDKNKIKAAALLGCFGGLFADIDVLFQSTADPLLFLEYHRQFTHSLIFIPLGALICSLLSWPFSKKHLNFRQAYLFCFLGYATHGLLDSCTTYGTQLFWPFSDTRIAWNTVSIVDPLFTLPLLALLITGVVKRNPIFPRIAFIWALTYLGLGLIQRDRAVEAGWELAKSRGHAPIRLEAKPGFGNLLLWKVVYETEDTFFVDAIRVIKTPKVFSGEHIEKLNLQKHFTWLNPDSQQAKDIERFRWFSNQYLAIDKTRSNYIIDVRYSMLPNEIKALWGIELDPEAGPEDHVYFNTDRRTTGEEASKLIRMLIE
jgi:inner membrane protein